MSPESYSRRQDDALGIEQAMKASSTRDRVFDFLARKQIGLVLMLLSLGGAFALANGLGYECGNLRQYLLHGLHALDPGFLAADWFTTQTITHHSAFTAAIVWMGSIGPLDVAFGVANAVFAIVFVICIYWLAERLYRNPLVVTAIAVFVITFSSHNRLGWTAIINSYFQPSTIGGVGLLAGLTCLIRSRYKAAGIFLFVAALFHVHYMVWVVLIGGVSVLMNLNHVGIRRALHVMVPVGAAVIYHLPFLAMVSGPEQAWYAQDATRILHEVYAPCHYRPLTWGIGPFVQFGATMLAGVVALGFAGPTRRVGRMAGTVLALILVVVLGGLACTTIGRSSFVAWLFPYRLVPFLCLVSQLLVAGALVSTATSPRFSVVRILALWGILLGLLYAGGVNHYGLVSIGLVLVPLFAGRLAQQRNLSSTRLLFTLLGLLLIFLCCGAGRGGLLFGGIFVIGAVVYRLVEGWRFRCHVWLRPTMWGKLVIPIVVAAFVARLGLQRKDILGQTPQPSEEVSLYDWCRENSDRDDVFVVPPILGGFRLGAERAVVIDWKCMPVLAKDTTEWYRRLVKECGTEFRSVTDAEQGYAQIDTARAIRLAGSYGAGYLVTNAKEHRGDLSHLPLVYANDGYRVFNLGKTLLTEMPVAFMREAVGK